MSRFVVVSLLLAAACSAPASLPVDSGMMNMDLDSGVPDAGPGCPDVLASTTLQCGTLAWAKSAIGTHPRNHHLSDVAQTDAGTFLYVVGGFDGTNALTNVDRSLINADGTLGAFADSTPLPAGLLGMTGGVVSNLLVVAGGQGQNLNNNSASAYAVIQGDGSLGAWQHGEDIGNIRMHAGAIARGTTMYVMGGFNGNNVWTDVVQASVYPNSTLSTWTPAGTMPGPRSHFAASMLGDYVYLTGGLSVSAFLDPPNLPDVTRAHVLASGELGEWTPMTPLTVAISTHASAFYGGYLYVGGGINATAPEKRFWRAPVNDDFTLGAWTDSTPLPTPRGHVHSLPFFGNHMYSIAGATNFNLAATGDIQIGTFQ